MKTFRKLLTKQPEPKDPCWKALLALTKVSPSRLIELTYGFTWHPW